VGSARCIKGVRGAEGVGDGLVEAKGEEDFADGVYEELFGGGTADGGAADGQTFGDALVSVDAPDFFDEVFFAEEVGPPGGDDGFEAVGFGVFGDGATEAGEVVHGFVSGDGHPEEFAAALEAEGEGDLGGRGWPRVGDTGFGGFAGDLLVEIGESVEGANDTGGVYAAFEAVAGFGLEAELFAGSTDGCVDEVCAFEEAAGGGGADFAVEAAHDAGDGDRLFSVADEHLSEGEGAFDFVECDEGFAGFGESDDDAFTGKFVEIEGVEGLTGFEHNEVG